MGFVGQNDEARDDVTIGERFDRAVEGLDMDGMKIERLAVAIGPWERLGIVRELEKGSEVDVEGGMFDAEGKGIIDHLDLKAFFTGGSGERFLIGSGLSRLDGR